jgi:hypothetical protein
MIRRRALLAGTLSAVTVGSCKAQSVTAMARDAAMQTPLVWPVVTKLQPGIRSFAGHTDTVPDIVGRIGTPPGLVIFIEGNHLMVLLGDEIVGGLVVVISDIHALGLATANGLVFTTAFYWDRDEASRGWSKRFFERTGRMPGMVQAGTYSAVLHYLKAMEAAGTADGKAVADKIRELPVDDFFAKGRVREDGRMMHDMYLVEVKTPSDSALDAALGTILTHDGGQA